MTIISGYILFYQLPDRFFTAQERSLGMVGTLWISGFIFIVHRMQRYPSPETTLKSARCHRIKKKFWRNSSNTSLSVSLGVQNMRKWWKLRGKASMFLLFSSVWSPLMKHNKLVWTSFSNKDLQWFIAHLFHKFVHVN